MHITLRVPQELLKAIDETAAKEAVNRSKWIKQTLRKAVVNGSERAAEEGGLSTLHDLIEVELSTIQEGMSTIEAIPSLLESILKLAIESVMISRQLALVHGPRLLQEAQANARDYYARAASTEKGSGNGSEASQC